MAEHADVIVIGAGPAGCAAAIRLAEDGHQVLLLEREFGVTDADRTSGEVVAPGTQVELELLGIPTAGDWVLDLIAATRNVFPDGRWITFPFPDGFRYYNVHRSRLETVLRARAVAAGADLRTGVRVKNVKLAENGVVVRSECDEVYSGRLLLDAGGRNAPTLRRLDLKIDEPEVRQIGVAVFFRAFDGYVPDTWDRHFYGERGAMISGGRIEPGKFRYILEADWSEQRDSRRKPIEFYEDIARKHDAWMAARLETEPRLGRVWSMAPLGYRVRELTRDRLMLLGDAAGYLSPITGQGIEFAMRSARLAATVADKALRDDDLTQAAFAPYVEGHRTEVLRQVAALRVLLAKFRNRDLLMRCPDDRDALYELLGPIANQPGEERGRL
jgi:menaquinone-9 beta-reductase